jgi:hypothetical protein
MRDQLYKPTQNSLEKHGSSVDRRRFLVTGLGIGFGVVAGSLMPTATSFAASILEPSKGRNVVAISSECQPEGSYLHHRLR